MRLKSLTGSGEPDDSIRAEVAVIAAQAAVGDQVPVIRIINQAERFNLAPGRFIASTRAIGERKNSPMRESVLDLSEDGLRRCFPLWRRDEKRRCLFQTIQMILLVVRQNRTDFQQRRTHLRLQRRIGQMLDQFAAGKTPTQLSQDIKTQLSQFIRDPLVSVIVDNFSGTFSQQIRVVGATEKPASIPYRANMTLLDAMIAVGGLSEFAAGNKAKLIRQDKSTGKQSTFGVRIGDLLKRGDSKANVRLEPGDVIIIPESMF